MPMIAIQSLNYNIGTVTTYFIRNRIKAYELYKFIHCPTNQLYLQSLYNYIFLWPLYKSIFAKVRLKVHINY